MKQAAWLVVARKELLDAARDRRALLALLLFPLLGPLLIYFMFNSILDMGEEALSILLPVIGERHAPDLIDHLRQNGIEIQPLELPQEARGSLSPAVLDVVRRRIDSRQADFVLIIPDDFGQRLARAQPVNVELHHDSTRTTASAKVGRLRQLIQAWSREMALLRLLARGESPQVINPLSLQTIDVASAQARGQSILGMIPLYVIMAAFVTGMGVAVDATAGERERKSLEPLLTNPVSRVSLVMGKWLAAVAFSAAGLVLVLLLNLLVLSQVPLERMGLTMDIGPVEIAGILLTTLPLALLASALQILVGIFARSLKDAQAYLSLIMLLPMAPFFYNIFNSQGREFWMNFVPLLGQNMLLTDVVSGRAPPLADFVLAGSTVLLCALLFLLLAARAFKRERIIFT